MENKSIKRIKDLGKMYYEQTPWEFLVSMDQAAAEAILDSEAKKSKSIVMAQRNILGTDKELIALVNEHYEEHSYDDDSMDVILTFLSNDINDLRRQVKELKAKLEEKETTNVLAPVEEELMEKPVEVVELTDPTPVFLGGDN